MAEHLIDEAVFGDHPLGRSVLGTVEHLSETFTRDGIIAFRARRWAPSRGAAFAVGNLAGLGSDGAVDELFARFPGADDPGAYDPAPALLPRILVTERDSNQSHLRMSYRPRIDPADPRQRAALTIYATLLGGSMGSRLFEEIREKRGLCYSVYAADHAFADVPILQLGSGLESAKCIEAYGRMREIVDELREQGPTAEEVERARAYAAGRLVLAFENTNAVARYGASQAIVRHESIDPDAAIAALDAVTFDEVREVAAGVADRLAVACVGPHAADDF
jgi:predicted Zn-dependent peptidase